MYLTFYFNSRPSARGDDLLNSVNRLCNYFNSRPSARGDAPNLRNLKLETISIHAPPRGATSLEMDKISKEAFQFTPLREGRRRTAGKRNF